MHQRELASPAIGLSPRFGLSWFTQYQTQPSFAGLCLYCVDILQTCLWHCFPPLLGTFGLHPVVVLGLSGSTTVCLICTDCLQCASYTSGTFWPFVFGWRLYAVVVDITILFLAGYLTNWSGFCASILALDSSLFDSPIRACSCTWFLV